MKHQGRKLKFIEWKNVSEYVSLYLVQLTAVQLQVINEYSSLSYSHITAVKIASRFFFFLFCFCIELYSAGSGKVKQLQ